MKLSTGDGRVIHRIRRLETSYPQESEFFLNPTQMLIGFGLASIVAGLAYLAGSLSISGAVAAVCIGIMTFGVGGGMATILLLLFFISSSLLSKVGGVQKKRVASAFAKGGRRDWAQVLANGLLASSMATLYGISGELVWLAGMAGALAASNADTWSTELGVLAKRWPRRILSGEIVEPGTSGGITLEGTLASLAGATLIALAAAIGLREWLFLPVVILAGFLGGFVDSLLGASVQTIYFCSQCGKETERHPAHACGTPTTYLRGWRWMNNDSVNCIASLTGMMIAILGWNWLL